MKRRTSQIPLCERFPIRTVHEKQGRIVRLGVVGANNDLKMEIHSWEWDDKKSENLWVTREFTFLEEDITGGVFQALNAIYGEGDKDGSSADSSSS